MSKTVSSTFNKSDNTLSVTLYPSGFSKDGERVGKVTRNTVTLENMIAEIIEENHGLDPYMVQHAAILLQQQILKTIQLGKAVNVLDLGVLYIGIKGSVKGDNPASSDIPDFILRFTPSALANDSLSSLQVDKILISDTNPHITLITDTWTNQDNMVSCGKICRITGDRLKLGGDAYSLSFIPLEADGTESETLPAVPVAFDKIVKNTQSTLEFYVPDSLDSSIQYAVRIETSYLGSTQSRKTPITGTSNPVEVIS